MSRFRSWIEDWKPAPEPIDLDAFAYRRKQRRDTANARKSKRLAHTGEGARLALAQRTVEQIDLDNARLTDPIEQAKVHLQRRGCIVYRASVDGGPLNRWRVSIRREVLTDAELMALAEAKGFQAVTHG